MNHNTLYPFAIYKQGNTQFNLALDYDARETFPNPVSAKLVWAAALMAKELNGDYVKRDGHWEFVSWTDENGNYQETHEMTKLSNVDMMRGLVYYYSSHLADYVEEAERLIGEAQLDFMFKALTNDTENYEDGLIKLIGKESINYNEYGVLAFAPYYMEKKEAERNLADRLGNSKHIGSYNDEVTLALETISVRESKGDYGGWNVTAVTDDGCLVTFFTSKHILTKQDGWYAVKAKVKSHQLDWRTKSIPETRINYVKLL